jgi:hypothetical protein
LVEEAMPWQQLHAYDSAKTFLDTHYDIKTIPKAYLYNHEKKLIKKFDDGSLMTGYIRKLFEN